MSKNKSIPLSVALAFAASVTAGAVFAQEAGQTEDFSKADKNNDKYVSSSEFEEWQDSVFGNMDADRNDELSEAEFLVIGVRRPTGETPQQREARRRTEFKQMDRDSKGYVTKDQYIEHGEKAFDEADTNKDGKLTPQEFKAAEEKTG